MPFKVVMRFPDGTSEDQDELFDTESDADQYGQVQVHNYATGAEVLHMSNPGDYPLDDDDADYEVIEVDG